MKKRVTPNSQLITIDECIAGVKRFQEEQENYQRIKKFLLFHMDNQKVPHTYFARLLGLRYLTFWRRYVKPKSKKADPVTPEEMIEAFKILKTLNKGTKAVLEKKSKPTT